MNTEAKNGKKVRREDCRPKISERRYREACREYEGWCTACGDFTTCEVEPDAVGYRCDCCDENTVMGAEEALLCGEFIFSGMIED